MRRSFMTVLTGAALASVAGTGLAAAPANAATVGGDCVVTVAQAHGRQAAATRTVCGAAAAHVRETQTLLLIGMENPNYGGRAWPFYGSFGACDAEGYKLNTDSEWAKLLSSYKLFNNCNAVTLTDSAGKTAGPLKGDQKALPQGFDNNVSSIRLTS